MEQPPPIETELDTVPNGFISSVICDNEDETLRELDLHYIFVADEESQSSISTNFSTNDTHDIHIVEKRETPTKPSNEMAIINKIKKSIMELCNVRNIIIYVLLANSSVKYNKFIQLFNDFLRTTLPDKYYSNIIIYNFFDSSHIKKTDPFYVKLDSCYKYCLSNINKKTFENQHTKPLTNSKKTDAIDTKYAFTSKKFFQVKNVTCKPLITIEQYEPVEPIKYIYKFIESSQLYNYDNIKSLISERRCSFGKLIQFTGTCWVNCLLNALLLPKTSRKYMIDQCRKNISEEQVKNKTKLKDIYKLRTKLTYNNILTSIIYHIFIKKELPSEFSTGTKNDFILTLADKLKRIWVSRSENIKFITKEEEILHTKNSVNFGIGAIYTCTVDSLSEILQYYLKDFEYTYRAFTFKFPAKYTTDAIKNLEKPPIEKRIKKGSSYYQLSSCILAQHKAKHVICGFICEGKEYIYNSNSRKAIECNWSNYNFQPYIDYYNQAFKIGLDPYDIFIELTIYTLETASDIEENEIAIKEVEDEANSMVIPDVPCDIPSSSSSSQALSSSSSSSQALSSSSSQALSSSSSSSSKQSIKTKQTKKCPRENQELIDGKCRVRCKEDQIRNPITGRCIKNRKTIKCPRSDQELINGRCYVKCKPNQLRNPDTGRCKKSINFLPF